MGESLILRRLGARTSEGKYAWKKSGTVLAEKTVNYSGSSIGTTNKVTMKIISEDDTSYFTEETFINAEITGTWHIKLFADGKCSYGTSTLEWDDGIWSYDAQKGELYMNLWRYGAANNANLSLSGSGISLQPTFGFIGYVVDNDAAKYPDSGTQGEYTYEKIQS